MFMLRNILFPLQQEFKHRCKGDERGVWFVYTLLAVITHFTTSRSANLLRTLRTRTTVRSDIQTKLRLPWILSLMRWTAYGADGCSPG